MYNTCVPQPRETMESCWGFSVALLKQLSPNTVVLGNIFITNPGQSVVKTHCYKDKTSPGIELTVVTTPVRASWILSHKLLHFHSFSGCSFNLVFESFLKDKSHFNRRKTNINPSLSLTPLPHQWQQNRGTTGHDLYFSWKIFTANCRCTALNPFLFFKFCMTFCPSFSWDRVTFLPSSSHSAVFCI